MFRISPASGAIALILGFACALDATASDPATHEVTVPTTPGETVVIEWTGTALPGATGLGGIGGLADPSAAIGCPAEGPDDAHAVTLTVPEGAYDAGSVSADFHIEWEAGDSYEVVSDKDLALTVYLGTTQVGFSDGGNPTENVGLANPEGGAYTVVVCPFTSVSETPYRAKLTLTALSTKACITESASGVLPLAAATSSATVFRPELRGLPNVDLFQAETADVAKPFKGKLTGRHQSAIYDETLGVPTFLWARTGASVAAVGALNERELLVAHARDYLRSEAKLLGLTPALIDEAEAFDAGFNGNGPAIVRFRQNVGGVEVFHRSLNVLLDRSYRPIAVSGYFATDFDRAAIPGFARTGAQAVASAWTSMGGSLSAAALSPVQTRGAWQLYSKPMLTGSHWFEREPRAKQVYYPRNGALEPAYHVELFSKARVNGNLSAYGLVVSARDGKVLHRKDLKADAFTYRTFAEDKGPLYQPYDSPLGNDYAPYKKGDRRSRVGAPTNRVTLDHAGIVTGDKWLKDDATQTTGNHVDACIDAIDKGVDTPAGGLAVPPPVNSCLDGVEPRAPVNGDRTFDYELQADSDPSTETAKNAAVVNLFYMNNWLHDWWYNHGFDEAAGNAQTDNYGRGTEGTDLDPILAQGQDASGRNNANMATPSDGSSPVMQQYLFDGNPVGEVRQTAPVTGPSLVWTSIANAGKKVYTEDGELALADEGQGKSPSDGCGEAIPYPAEVVELSPVGAPYQAPAATPQASLSGKIALVDRGNCNTTFKIQFAKASGAKAVIVVNNVDGDPPTNIGNLDIPLAPVQPTEHVYDIPTVIIRKDDGEALKAQLAAGQVVTMHMTREAAADVDGTLDNQIIAHEYFHYVHHRLTDSSSQQSGAMSEGWGDINAFMLTVREDDKLIPGNAAFGAAYGLAHYVTADFYKGIRRAPYSSSFDDNAYTLKHIADGEPTPDGGAGAGNSEVHAAGEIWANQVFECYAGVLRNPHNSFEQAQSKMQDYIIGGLKMTPADATFTEARDAILSVVMASDFEDYTRCSRGFARRGSGLNAVSPARSSDDLVGVTEDYTEFVCYGSGGGGGGGGNGGGGGSGNGGELPAGGAGALGLWLLAPLFGIAALRRRVRR